MKKLFGLAALSFTLATGMVVMPQSTKPASAEYVCTSSGRLNLRSYASSKSKTNIIGKLYKGWYIEVVNYQNDGWAYVYSPQLNRYGFVASRYLVYDYCYR